MQGQPSSLFKLTWEHQKPKTGMSSFQRTLRSISTTPWSLWRRFTSPTSFHFPVWLSSSAVSREDTLQHSTPRTPGWLRGNDVCEAFFIALKFTLSKYVAVTPFLRHKWLKTERSKRNESLFLAQFFLHVSRGLLCFVKTVNSRNPLGMIRLIWIFGGKRYDWVSMYYCLPTKIQICLKLNWFNWFQAFLQTH